ncbi:hypothetical protein K036_4326, partial [Acinetobacter baumannii 42057_5]
MIRDQETLNQLVDMIRQFVEGVLIPHENEVAETDEIPPLLGQDLRILQEWLNQINRELSFA